MRILLLLLLVSTAQAAVNLQTCGSIPTTGGLMGCQNVSFAPVAPTTLVRSQINGAQGWRVFSSLASTAQVYAQDGAWHALGSITPALATPPVITPPSPTQAAVADVVILWNGVPAMGAVFPKLPTNVAQCFQITSGARSTQVCLPP